MSKANNFVSGGRNPQTELTCFYPPCCFHFRSLRENGSWCSNPKNRLLKGCSPFITETGGCDLHSMTPRRDEQDDGDYRQRRAWPPEQGDDPLRWTRHEDEQHQEEAADDEG